MKNVIILLVSAIVLLCSSVSHVHGKPPGKKESKIQTLPVVSLEMPAEAIIATPKDFAEAPDVGIPCQAQELQIAPCSPQAYFQLDAIKTPVVMKKKQVVIPLKNHRGSATYNGRPSPETVAAVNEMADRAFKLKAPPKKELT